MILILGGGLAGLSTAYHLGDEPHLVLEATDAPGGLCGTREVDGFHFDYTGHLLHLRDARAERLVGELMPGAFRTVARRARIRTKGVDLPFPFQANLHGLPREQVVRSVLDFVDALGRKVPDDPRASFEEWCLAVFGRGISDGFMFPYNTKLFRREPAAMTADWVSWAVPRPSLEEVVRGALGAPNEGMGYNATFRYPHRGGIRVVPDAFASRVDHVRLDARVEAVDLDARTVHLAGGERLGYSRLVVTAPLPSFLRMARGGETDWPALAEPLDWSVVACVNLGVAREGLGHGSHWVYLPDPDVPFYRVGFPTNFSDAVAPPGTSSMYVEFGLRRDEAADDDELADRAVEGLLREGLLRRDDEILVRDVIRIDPGYVLFDRARQQAMARALPSLERLGVHCIGRYGAWTYSYMERAMLDGLQLADRLRRG